MCTVQRWTAMSGHSAASAFETRRAVDDDQLRRRQSTPDEIVEQRAPGRLAPSPPMLLIASSIFRPSARTPSATSNEIEVALLSSRTRATVP